MRDAELLRDLAQVALHAALILHHRGAADHFEIGQLGEVGQGFILHAVGKKCVVGVATENFKKRKNLGRDLNEQPGHDRVRNGDLVDVASFKLSEEIPRIHPEGDVPTDFACKSANRKTNLPDQECRSLERRRTAYAPRSNWY